MDISKSKIILASGSPRRHQLLKKICDEFEIIVPQCKEFSKETSPDKIVQDLACQKSRWIIENIQLDNLENNKTKSFLIIASDTLVELNGKILGKPQNRTQAAEMLNRLQNNWHTVWTGVSIHYINDSTTIQTTFCEKSQVHMSKLSPSKIEDYINTGSPMDKAGAYGIQDLDGKLVDTIKGEYDNVMGLPTKRLKEELEKL